MYDPNVRRGECNTHEEEEKEGYLEVLNHQTIEES